MVDGKIEEEIGLDDGVTALTQLGLIKAAPDRSRRTTCRPRTEGLPQKFEVRPTVRASVAIKGRR